MPHELAVFVRAADQLKRAQAAAKASALPFKILDDHVEIVSGHLSIGTMHLAKGLEFRAVVVMACDDEIIPLRKAAPAFRSCAARPRGNRASRVPRERPSAEPNPARYKTSAMLSVGSRKGSKLGYWKMKPILSSRNRRKSGQPSVVIDHLAVERQPALLGSYVKATATAA
jgi:superfamily I DNA/RNA helicase